MILNNHNTLKNKKKSTRTITQNEYTKWKVKWRLSVLHITERNRHPPLGLLAYNGYEAHASPQT